ncbi:MAG: periplasmic flagellar collar protein FlcA [Spirochaetota bacterium]
MPEKKDLEKISKMLEELGEKELEIGEMKEGVSPHKEEVIAPEVQLEGEVGLPGEVKQPGEVGLEKPEIEKPEIEKPEVEKPEVEKPMEELKEALEIDELLKDIEVGIKEERELEEKLKGKAVEEEAGLKVEAPERLEEELVSEKAEGEEAPEEVVAGEEELFDLPEDFKMEKLSIEEGPPGPIELKEEAERVIEIEAEAEEIGEEVETPEVKPEVSEVTGEISIPEIKPSEVEQVPEEVMEEMPAVEEISEIEGLAVEEAGVEEIPGAEKEAGLKEEPGFELEEHEFPLEAEEPPVGARIEEIGMPELEELMKPVIEEEGEEPFIEGGELEEEVAPPEEALIELSDEDILFIKEKLTRLSPHVAYRVKDIIVGEGLSVQETNRLLALLLRDSPEREIVQFIERITGKPLLPVAVIPEVITVKRKPGVIGTLAETLGPVARVGSLFILIVLILGVLYILYLHRPLRANKYYKEGIEYLIRERYPEAEESFQKAVAIYKSVKQYNHFGWEYMLSGNYDLAEEKFTQGIALDERFRNLSIRINLAKLYNVLENYEKADYWYSQVLEKKPEEYEYIKLKGLNLVEWGKKQEPERLNEAYELFEKAILKYRKNNDPFFRMLSIDIALKNDEGVNYFYDYILKNFPSAVDPEIYTELARYLLQSGRFEDIRDILLKVLKKYPNYPPAHYTFASYYRSVNNRRMEEDFLKAAIRAENDRELRYPWEKRDRELLSDAYNGLGEIYYQKETAGTAAEAINYFKKAIEENPRNSQANFNLAQAYFYRERNYPMARYYYERARDTGYRSNDIYYNLGLIHYYEGSFSSALQYWYELSRIIPDNPYLSNAMGSAFLHLGKYNAALGEYLRLSEVYDRLVKNLGEIKTWRAHHRRIVLESAAVHNNLGVAYQKLYETARNPEYQKNALVALYKAGELADLMGTDRGKIQYNIQYILHPEVIRGDMAISDDLSEDYRFVVQ